MSKKPIAGLSLDLDNLWCYLKEKGDLSWHSYPSFFKTCIPRISNMLKQKDLKITFFIVGQDALVKENQEFLKALSLEGHEMGNHSFHHDPTPNQFTREELITDIQKSSSAIENATGQRPKGYRGPAFAMSQTLLEVLQSEGYFYDSTTFPTFIAPLARLFYFWKTGLRGKEREKRSELYGDFSKGFQPLKPYAWKLQGDKTLLELPVTTIPFLKTPFHMSYLFFLYGISPTLMRGYLKSAIQACRLTRTPPNFLLHPTDFLGGDLVPEMSFFPGMQIPTDEKVEVVDEVLSTIGRYYQFVPLTTLAAANQKENDV